MKIKLNANDKRKLESLFETKENNIQISMMFSYLLDNIYLFNEEEIKKYQKDYNCSLKEAYFHYCIDIWELDYENEENLKILNDYVKNSFCEIDMKEYMDDPYYKNIKINVVKDRNYHLFYDHYSPFEMFPLNDVSINSDYLEKSTFGFSKTNFKFIALNLNNETWMSITPNEINTMKNSIKNAKGNVLVMGLGLGYFPYMISQKDDVKKIDVIEFDKQIIDIFNNNIFPSFENKKKIQIINKNAFEINKEIISTYDFVYIDLYHNPVDGLPIYLKFKKIESSVNVKFEYWLEEGILAYLRRLIITVMQESIEGYNDNDYRSVDNKEDEIINEIYFKTKNIEFNHFDEIKTYLNNDSLKKLAKTLF